MSNPKKVAYMATEIKRVSQIDRISGLYFLTLLIGAWVIYLIIN